ncbi:MAG: Stp1/IreP family PP2C-type Ser/Thr phosphatase [Candidatus Ventricola sp.]
MAAALRTDIGRVRSQNEDAAWADDARGLYAVADGMGGHLAGEVASRLAIEAVQRMAGAHGRADTLALREMVHRANDDIVRHAQQHAECAGMGTTLSVLWRGGRFMYIAHVGDSRIYRLRGGTLEQITQDHSLVEELVRARVITREQARTHPRRNIITRALGTQGDNAPDLLAADTQPGDLWLLCTDGLSGMLTDEMIEAVMRRDIPLEEMADSLLSQALEAGGRDNVTLILCREGEG